MAFASRMAFRWKQVPPLGGRLPAEALEELRSAAIYTPPSLPQRPCAVPDRVSDRRCRSRWADLHDDD